MRAEMRTGMALIGGLIAGVIFCGAGDAPPRAARAASKPAAPAVAELPGENQIPRLVPLIRIPAVVNDVHDGDTLSLSFDFSARIRLIECWAPEMSTGDPGRASKANLIRLVGGDPRCELEIPLFDDLGKSTTLGRILGRVRMLRSARDLSSLQVEQGFATRKKLGD